MLVIRWREKLKSQHHRNENLASSELHNKTEFMLFWQKYCTCFVFDIITLLKAQKHRKTRLREKIWKTFVYPSKNACSRALFNMLPSYPKIFKWGIVFCCLSPPTYQSYFTKLLARQIMKSLLNLMRWLFSRKIYFMSEKPKSKQRNSYSCKIICTWRIMIFLLFKLFQVAIKINFPYTTKNEKHFHE